jgi:DNA end-binding protein Ku
MDSRSEVSLPTLSLRTETGIDGLAGTNLQRSCKVVRKRGWRPPPRAGARKARRYPMAPARPYWKGYLKLSLVSCPICLYSGTSSTERVAFRQIHKKTGNRLRQQLVDEVTREPVEGPDKGRGYEYAKNAYLTVEDDELDAIAIESTHTIEIDSFVPRDQIDARYLDTPFYIKPDGEVGQEAFAVIREAMRGKDMVGLGRVVLSKRERVIMLEPWDKGLIATTLRYLYEVRTAEEYFEDIPDLTVEPEMLKLAEHIVKSKAADFEPSQLVDHYEEALVAMLKQKQAGIVVSRERAEPQPRNVVNIMDALRQSIAKEHAASAMPKKSRKRSDGQREMLLPIPGKKKQVLQKPAHLSNARQKKAG